MDTIAYYRSLTQELEALKDRVRNLIAGSNWQTDGEWKESILRDVLRRHIPASLSIGRGFIVSPTRQSKQIDILVYDPAVPLLFRDGDLAFVTPDAVRVIIEVKSSLSTETLNSALKSLRSNGETVYQSFHDAHDIRKGSKQILLGLFSFELEVKNTNTILKMLQTATDGSHYGATDLLSLGCDKFVKRFDHLPQCVSTPTEGWNAYELQSCAAGYFVGSIVQFCASCSVLMNQKTWFPFDEVNLKRVGSIPLSLPK